MLIIDTQTTINTIVASLNRKPAESFVGLPCTLHISGTSKPSTVTAQTPYSYIIEALDGTAIVRLSKTATRAMWPTITI